ncbi:4'-phosphopantetheinyl transferase superfamily protein [Arthrobacter sp. ZGTC131]|uniref:4'-phosphopantetheinyl transferase family protein n=1 Tax=Arthrobacter sp. ZGTC131 TaxID=2058898 RepID=UPI0021586822|nr:4'-phosphopantetheinyl transferase superfamily protein [Arthrobacter sp. ZGTC131]
MSKTRKTTPAGVVFRAFPDGPADDSLLDPAELERAGAMQPAVRTSFVSGRAAQRQFAAELLGVHAADLRCDYSCPRCGTGPGLSHGRPGYARSGVRLPLLLSLSRAAGWTLVAAVVSPPPGLRLGVDIEDPSATGFPGFGDIALTEAERRALLGCPDEDLPLERARLWARKEAWLKMTGEGLLVPPGTVDVLSRPGISDPGAAATGLPSRLVAAVALG